MLQANHQEETHSLKYLKILEDFIQQYWPRLKKEQMDLMASLIFTTTLRNDLMKDLFNDLYTGIIQKSFHTATNGNIYDYLIDQKYKPLAIKVKTIVVGGNGGNASIGKGEWLLSLFSGINPETKEPNVKIIKNGQGDTLDNWNGTVEVKWNGGKVDVGVAGNVVQKKFNRITGSTDEDWIPFRLKNKKDIASVMQNKNANYWKSISGEEIDKLTDNELKKKIINMAFEEQFKKSNSFIMFNDDGKFQRFHSVKDANAYYSDRLDSAKFECRAKKTNPVALYCHVF